MQQRLVLLAITCLLIAGCAKHTSAIVEGDPFNTPAGPQTVYVWDGQKCIETKRTPEQLREAESLTTHVVQNGAIQKFQLYAENVPPGVTRKLFKEGGTIELPNGDRMNFPAGMDPTRSATYSTGQATLANGKRINFEGGTASLPLAEIVTVQNGQIPINGELVQVVGAPDGTQVQQTTYMTRHGEAVLDIDFAEPALPTPDKSEWWKTQPAAPSSAQAGVKIPPASSVNGRVGYASASYGMGQISKP